MRRLVQLARDWAHGFRAGIDVLLWGQPYPRTISLDELRRLKHRPNGEPTT